MSKSQSRDPLETKSRREASSRQSVSLTAATRIDPPHEKDLPGFELSADEKTPPINRVADDPDTEQIRLQAGQLSTHLRTRQKELDGREAELNSRIARLESDSRAARLWLNERETDLAACGEELAKQRQELATRSETLVKMEQEVAIREQAAFKQQEAASKQQEESAGSRREAEKRLARLAAAEAALQKRASTSTARQDEELLCLTETMATRKKQIDEAEIRLAEAQAETQKLYEQLPRQRRAFAEETAAIREQMAAEHRQAMADLEQKRQAVGRRADHVDQCRTALKQLRAEFGRMHRETLEIRLATEELWVQLSGAAPPAALTRSLGRIRTKLAEQYAQANAELAEQRKELEAIRSQLVERHEALVEQKRRFDQWTAGRHEEGQQYASRLVAREEQLHQKEQEIREQSQRWESERMKYQQELRRLRSGFFECEEAVVSH